MAQRAVHDTGGHDNNTHLLSTYYVQGMLRHGFHTWSSLTLTSALYSRARVCVVMCEKCKYFDARLAENPTVMVTPWKVFC